MLIGLIELNIVYFSGMLLVPDEKVINNMINIDLAICKKEYNATTIPKLWSADFKLESVKSFTQADPALWGISF